MKVKSLLIWSLVSFMLFSCIKKEDNDTSDEARDLFSLSADLIIDITDMIKTAGDSIQVDSLSQLFEKRITEINFAFPPETDMKLTEQENDSIFKLIESLRSVKKDKLISLSVQIPDSSLFIVNEENL